MRQDKASSESIDGLMRRFNKRLESILGSRRIPRAEKRAKAEETMRAVDELMSDIETELALPPKDDWGPAEGDVQGDTLKTLE